MPKKKIQDTAEFTRLPIEAHSKVQPWRRWGAYVAERAWGTVREDYSADGDAWDYFPHDMARSRAYRWSEDGIAGWCDWYQQLIFSFAFWNGKDPILKERLFGLNMFEGNHGEDVKECYYHQDATPSCSYMRYLYKYPQEAFPYSDLVEVSEKRNAGDREYELEDTGVFDDNRYFDIVIEYAKASPEDTCIRLEIFNRSPEDATIHILPHLWFRNRWSWFPNEKRIVPTIEPGPAPNGFMSLEADGTGLPPPSMQVFDLDYRMAKSYLYGPSGAQLLFTENNTHAERVFGEGAKSETLYVKDAFHRYVIDKEDSVNSRQTGSKACFYYEGMKVPAGKSLVLKMRLTSDVLTDPLQDIDDVMAQRKADADEFYDAVHPERATAEERQIQRHAFAGMIWSCQFYIYNVDIWLNGDNPLDPPPADRELIRNGHWRHFNSIQVLSMPDKWEYPWFAAWDLAFHCVTLALVDIGNAKVNFAYLLEQQRQHTSGQLPAYEWEFSELNPPVQAWALWRIYQHEKRQFGKGDLAFLSKAFHKIAVNFDWWANQVDRLGNNLFEGGFLGLDNISVIDRSKPLPGGGTIEQSDGTGWMGLFALSLMRISLELAKTDSVYEEMAIKYFDNFVAISAALHKSQSRFVQMWDEEDKFFYDVLCHPDGTQEYMKIRSLVGIVPLFGVDFVSEEELATFPQFRDHVLWSQRYGSVHADRCLEEIETQEGKGFFLSLVSPEQYKDVLTRVWDPNEFRSSFGMRSLSKFHQKNPYRFANFDVRYEPGEGEERIKGGNSNWRGPIWFPVNLLLLDALAKLDEVFGKTMQIEVPGEAPVCPSQMRDYFAKALVSLFKKSLKGGRTCHGDDKRYVNDPHWQDLILFYEHFHAETGRGLGASHQTGWTGLVANLIDEG
jgi:hypothetical protein